MKSHPSRRSFFSLVPEEVKQILSQEEGFPPFKARELLRWVYKKRTLQPSRMTTLSRQDRERVDQLFAFHTLKVEEKHLCADGTQKLLFQLEDGEMVETVIIPQGKRRTLCISSQVGCPVGCTFCASGLFGLKRHLLPHEMVEQFVHARYHAKGPITNLVVMGMGEPFLNFSNVWKALAILNHPEGMKFGIRRITVSTVGIKKLLPRIFSAPLHPRLAISLHAPTDELRRQLIPFPALMSVKEIVNFLEEYTAKKLSRVTLEYVLLRGVNDSPRHAHLLGKQFSHLPVRFNLIPYNPIEEADYESPTDEEVYRFAVVLEGYNLRATVRSRHGDDIQAACGQLRLRHLSSSPKGTSPERL